MAGKIISADGNSDWILMKRGVDYRVDITADTWGGSTSVGLETASESGSSVTLKEPGDEATDFAATANRVVTVRGPGRVRAVTTSYSGTSNLLMVVNQTEC